MLLWFPRVVIDDCKIQGKYFFDFLITERNISDIIFLDELLTLLRQYKYKGIHNTLNSIKFDRLTNLTFHTSLLFFLYNALISTKKKSIEHI